MLSKSSEMRRDDGCLDFSGGDNVIVYQCHSQHGNQEWEYRDVSHSTVISPSKINGYIMSMISIFHFNSITSLSVQTVCIKHPANVWRDEPTKHRSGLMPPWLTGRALASQSWFRWIPLGKEQLALTELLEWLIKCLISMYSQSELGRNNEWPRNNNDASSFVCWKAQNISSPLLLLRGQCCPTLVMWRDEMRRTVAFQSICPFSQSWGMSFSLLNVRLSVCTWYLRVIVFPIFNNCMNVSIQNVFKFI